MNHIVKCLLISLIYFFYQSCFALDASANNPAPLFSKMPNLHFMPDTKDKLAEQYFNQGLVFFYGFDYLESVRSFAASTKVDPNCARCYWALSLALGSIENTFLKGDEVKRALAALAKAKKHVKLTDLLTRDLIDALAYRYVEDSLRNGAKINMKERQIDYPAKNAIAFSQAMYQLTKKYPDNDNVLALFAYTVFDVAEWKFWNNLLNPHPYTVMMLDTLERALTINPNNVGAIHYYIHALEWSAYPTRALPYAMKLVGLAPLSEHLVHMPTHIFFRLGQYQESVKWNQEAVQSYHEYSKQCQTQGFKPNVNFLNQHNYDFLFAAALMSGNQKISDWVGDAIRVETPVEWLKIFSSFQRFYVLKYWSLARFGQWEAALKLPRPPHHLLYQRAMWHYVRALAAIQTNQKQLSKEELALLKSLQSKISDATFKKHANIAALIVEAHMARKNKKWSEAIANWHAASVIQSSITHNDPPSWYFPCAQGLGYAFLAANKPQEALAAFKADLAHHPKNGWSLFGEMQAYIILKQNVKTKKMGKQFKKAWQGAAVKLPIAQGNDIM